MGNSRLELDDLYRLNRLQDAKFSPCGRLVVYVVAMTENDSDLYSIRLVNRDSQEERILIADLPMVVGIAWSPDGKKLTYMGKADKATQVFVFDLETATNRAMTDLKYGVGGAPVWSPDGRYLAFSAVDPEKMPDDSMEPLRTTRMHYLFDGMGFLDRVAKDICVLPAEGGEIQKLTSDDSNNVNPCWSPDSQSVLFTAQFSENNPRAVTTTYSVNLNGEVTELFRDTSISSVFWVPPVRWNADGSKAFFAAMPADKVAGSQFNLYAISGAGGEVQCCSESIDLPVSPVIVTDFPSGVMPTSTPRADISPHSALITVEKEGATLICRLSLDGEEKLEPLIDPGCCVYLLDVHQQGLLFAKTDFNQPPELFISDLQGQNIKQLSMLNPELSERFDLPVIEELRFPSADGTSVQGWVMRPAQIDEPLPTVLCIHGGPFAAWGHTFSAEFHSLYGQGYAVAIINPRGSTGYGDEFGTGNQNCWGEPEFDDFMAGLDLLQHKGVADPERLGVCGISGGGHLSAWLTCHTDRFVASVPEQGVYNMITQYLVADGGPDLVGAIFNTTPTEGFETLWKYSPVAHGHKIKTPTLLIQGEEDLRCPMEQAEQLYRVMKEAGCKVEFMRMKGFHGATKVGHPKLRRQQDEAQLDWFARYLK
ncbi:S9 family peptidase [Pseudomaricurvus alkylphenolicus]|uniref:S9 family peptidase n=1 Tax=Pseudomaricurvus alkylphenolicus TaxID=1306991 RepID=UPI00141FF95C|nr:S9 family peptidase [Pseudomaricurvus alkylphenolicus]NIB41594.1 S9 family peptidase [Pseudomaricurvus alkylphenolicus]